MKNIVFLLGESGSGKDTVASIFTQQQAVPFHRVSFADALKDEYAKLIGVDVSVLHIQGPEKEKHRKGIIEYAERKKIEEGACHWLNKGFEPYLNTNANLVVSDCRRVAEVQWIKQQKEHNPDLHIYVIHLVRPETNDWDQLTLDAIQLAYKEGIVNTQWINDKEQEDLIDLVDDFVEIVFLLGVSGEKYENN